MSRLEIPISGQKLFSTGDIKLWIEMSLFLKDHAGHWHKRSFRVDTGTDVTTFPAYEAKRWGFRCLSRLTGRRPTLNRVW